MKRKTTGVLGNQRGDTLIELSLSFLLFFTMLCAVMEFGRAVCAYNVLAGAAREGARYAIVHGSASGSPATNTDIQTVVRRWAIGLDSSSVNVTTTWASGNGPGAPVLVTVQYTLSSLTNFIPGIGSMTLGSRSQMVISQ